MSLSLFHRLRRCRVLITLALGAWLIMGSAAWAQAGCCASMGTPGTCAMHADGHALAAHEQHGAGCACSCAQGLADLSALQLAMPGSVLVGQARWPVSMQAVPKPGYAPPLRPPGV